MFDDYDPGLINDHGGGNVSWWQGYIRAEIGRCNDFWRAQVEAAKQNVHAELPLDPSKSIQAACLHDWQPYLESERCTKCGKIIF